MLPLPQERFSTRVSVVHPKARGKKESLVEIGAFWRAMSHARNKKVPLVRLQSSSSQCRVMPNHDSSPGQWHRPQQTGPLSFVWSILSKVTGYSLSYIYIYIIVYLLFAGG